MATAQTSREILQATGRRKTAVARIRLSEGTGRITVNGRALEDYFPLEKERAAVQAPLQTAEMLGSLDCVANVRGGGISGQAEAVMLGIARALKAMRAELDPALRDKGLLTRDSRMKERKKYGHKGARKSFQFSKR